MAKLVKATAEQAFLKIGLYGEQGTGKTTLSLLIAEGLAAMDKLRFAHVETERGTDFYTIRIPERKWHPEPFDFDRIVTRSLTETLDIVSTLDTSVYNTIVIDSITHLWEAARDAYNGPRLKNGAIPISAWGQIKKPYKDLMNLLVNGNFHVIICGREGIQMEKNEESGETEISGTKMKAEGETPYEPHILGRTFVEKVLLKGAKSQTAINKVFFEKDRTSILMGKTFDFPNFETVKPILGYLGKTQGAIQSPEEAAEQDQAALERQRAQEAENQKTLYVQISEAINGAKTVDELKVAWDLTKGKKGKLGDYIDTLEAEKDARKAKITPTL